MFFHSAVVCSVSALAAHSVSRDDFFLIAFLAACVVHVWNLPCWAICTLNAKSGVFGAVACLAFRVIFVRLFASRALFAVRLLFAGALTFSLFTACCAVLARSAHVTRKTLGAVFLRITNLFALAFRTITADGSFSA